MAQPKIAGNAGPENIQAAYNYQPMAASFGTTEIASANVSADSTQMQIEYLPSGQTFDDWTHMVTITLAGGGPTMEENAAAAKRVIAASRGMVQQKGKEIAFNSYDSPQNGPLALSRYTLGEGAAKEYIASITWISTPGFVTTIQAQSRGQDLSAADMQTIKKLVHLPD